MERGVDTVDAADCTTSVDQLLSIRKRSLDCIGGHFEERTGNGRWAGFGVEGYGNEADRRTNLGDRFRDLPKSLPAIRIFVPLGNVYVLFQRCGQMKQREFVTKRVGPVVQVEWDCVPLPVSGTREGDIKIAPPPSIVDPDATGRSPFIAHAASAARRAATGV